MEYGPDIPISHIKELLEDQDEDDTSSDNRPKSKILSKPNNYSVIYLRKQAELTEGQEFGELTLINSKPRSATIIASKYTEWAILTKSQFKKILEKHEIQKRDHLVKALESFNIFE